MSSAAARPLRSYQAEAIRQAREAIASGKRAPLIVKPTGSGKTRVGVEIAMGAVSRGNRVLWLAHRRELVEQAVESLVREGVARDQISALKAGASKSFNYNAPICVASTQSMLVASELPSAQVVVFDEAHHYVAAEWHRVAREYQKSIRVGLTATPQRSDNTSLGELFDSLIQVISVRELTDLGVLVPCLVVGPPDRMRSKTIAEDPVQAYREHAAGTSAIVFLSTVQEAKETAARFLSVGIPAACVEGSMSTTDRDRAIADFKAGRTKVLTNVYVLTEGFDHPPTETCILARGCGSASVYIQIVGRILRASPGKTRALLIDLTGAARAHGLPDDDREYSLDGEGIRLLDKPEAVRQCKQCGACFRPTAGPECPNCGHKPEQKPTEIIPTKLSPIERGAVASQQEKQRYYNWLCRERRTQNYSEGWVAHRYRARFGTWPNGMRESEAA